MRFATSARLAYVPNRGTGERGTPRKPSGGRLSQPPRKALNARRLRARQADEAPCTALSFSAALRSRGCGAPVGITGRHEHRFPTQPQHEPAAPGRRPPNGSARIARLASDRSPTVRAAAAGPQPLAPPAPGAACRLRRATGRYPGSRRRDATRAHTSSASPPRSRRRSGRLPAAGRRMLPAATAAAGPAAQPRPEHPAPPRGASVPAPETPSPENVPRS